MGVYYSDIRDINRGLPQGGVLSPMLWLMFFNEISSELDKKRRERGDGPGAFRDYKFADDLTTVITAPTEPVLQTRHHSEPTPVLNQC